MSKPGLDDFMRGVQQRDPHQPEFLQAVHEVMTSLWPFVERHPKYREQGLLETRTWPAELRARNEQLDVVPTRLLDASARRRREWDGT